MAEEPFFPSLICLSFPPAEVQLFFSLVCFSTESPDVG